MRGDTIATLFVCRLRRVAGSIPALELFFFFSLLLFFFCLISPPFFFLHARSATSMLKHFSSYYSSLCLKKKCLESRRL